MSDLPWNTLESTAKGTPVPPRVPESIWSVFWIYGGTFALFCGIGRMGQNLPQPFNDFVSTFGAGAAFAALVFAFYEWRHVERRWELYKKQEEAKLPIASKPDPVRIVETEKTPGGYRQTIHKYTNPPTSDFIVWLYNLRVADGRIPDERACEKQWRQSADEWLTILEKEGIISKLHPSGKTGRRWNPDIKPEDALGKFGYGVSPALSDDKLP